MGAVKFMDGYDYLPTGPVNGLNSLFLADGYFNGTFGNNDGNNMYPQPGRFGIGTSLRLNDPPGGTGAFRALDWRFGTGDNGWIFGIAFTQERGSGQTFRFYDGLNNADVLQIDFESTGIFRISVSGTAFRSRTGAVRLNSWNYVQVKLTSGILRVLVNGEIVINTVTPPSIQPFDAFRFTNGFNSGSTRFDDCYLIDLDEDGPYDDFLGNIVVRAQLPISNGSVVNWNPHGLSQNWQNVADAVLNAANYNDTDVVGDYDLYTMNPNAAARDIFAIQVKGSFAQDNGVQLYAAVRIKTGGVEFTGTQFGVPQLPGYTTINTYWDLNPDTTVAWTNADLNSIEAGQVLAASD